MLLRNKSQEDEEVGVDPTHSCFHALLRTVDWDLNITGEEKKSILNDYFSLKNPQVKDFGDNLLNTWEIVY